MGKDYSKSLNHLAWHIVCFYNNIYLASFFSQNIVWNEKRPSNVTYSRHFAFRQQKNLTQSSDTEQELFPTWLHADDTPWNKHIDLLTFQSYSHQKSLDRGTFNLSYPPGRIHLKKATFAEELTCSRKFNTKCIYWYNFFSWTGLWPRLLWHGSRPA